MMLWMLRKTLDLEGHSPAWGESSLSVFRAKNTFVLHKLQFANCLAWRLQETECCPRRRPPGSAEPRGLLRSTKSACVILTALYERAYVFVPPLEHNRFAEAHGFKIPAAAGLLTLASSKSTRSIKLKVQTAWDMSMNQRRWEVKSFLVDKRKVAERRRFDRCPSR